MRGAPCCGSSDRGSCHEHGSLWAQRPWAFEMAPAHMGTYGQHAHMWVGSRHTRGWAAGTHIIGQQAYMCVGSRYTRWFWEGIRRMPA